MNNEDVDYIEIENSEELDVLEYSNTSDTPVFNQVRVTKKDFSIFELYRKFKSGRLVLEVDFQRKLVWESKQQCELIESILMGLPLPIFYFKQQDDAKYVVVDGKQRLSTLFLFLEDGFSLKNLKILTFLNEKKYSDLIGELGIYQSQLEDYQVYSHVILPPTPDRVLFDIFDRVNRGGTKLNKQEIRNALYHGKGFEMLIRITKSEEFISATRISPDKDKRMKGTYLLNRFFAFYLFFENVLFFKGNQYKYNGDIDQLIEITLDYLNKASDSRIHDLENITLSSLQKAEAILGDGAFRKELNRSKPINMNIFETTMYLMAMLDIKQDTGINQQIYNKIYNVITDEWFLYCIGDSRDNTKKTFERFRMMYDIVKEI